MSNRGSGLAVGLATFKGAIAAKSRFIVRALTYCDLHYVEREEFAALLLSYPELLENLVMHFELTMPLAGSGRHLTEAVSFLILLFGALPLSAFKFGLYLQNDSMCLST